VLNSVASHGNPPIARIKPLVISLSPGAVTSSTAVENSCVKLGTKLWILWNTARSDALPDGDFYSLVFVRMR
jgi:hypothetical protein